MSENKHDIDTQLYNLNKTIANLCDQYMQLDTTVRGFSCLHEIIKTTPEIKKQILESINQTPASQSQTFADYRMCLICSSVISVWHDHSDSCTWFCIENKTLSIK